MESSSSSSVSGESSSTLAKGSETTPTLHERAFRVVVVVVAAIVVVEVFVVDVWLLSVEPPELHDDN